MKLRGKNKTGKTESLGEFCVRSFSTEAGKPDSEFISLYSGVPAPDCMEKKEAKASMVFAAMRGKVIT